MRGGRYRGTGVAAELMIALGRCLVDSLRTNARRRHCRVRLCTARQDEDCPCRMHVRRRWTCRDWRQASSDAASRSSMKLDFMKPDPRSP